LWGASQSSKNQSSYHQDKNKWNAFLWITYICYKYHFTLWQNFAIWWMFFWQEISPFCVFQLPNLDFFFSPELPRFYITSGFVTYLHKTKIYVYVSTFIIFCSQSWLNHLMEYGNLCYITYSKNKTLVMKVQLWSKVVLLGTSWGTHKEHKNSIDSKPLKGIHLKIAKKHFI